MLSTAACFRLNFTPFTTNKNYISKNKIAWTVSPVSLSDLQEADSHEEQTVGSNSTGKNLIEVPLQQELLQHQDQVRQHRVFLQGRGQ